MTNALALARAVYLHPEWDVEDGVVLAYPQYYAGEPEIFDPRNNPAQFVDVLAWLVQQKNFRSIGRKNVNINVMQARPILSGEPGTYGVRPTDIANPHDGTALSLVSAVVAAAERVAEDGKV